MTKKTSFRRKMRQAPSIVNLKAWIRGLLVGLLEGSQPCVELKMLPRVGGDQPEESLPIRDPEVENEITLRFDLLNCDVEMPTGLFTLGCDCLQYELESLVDLFESPVDLLESPINRIGQAVELLLDRIHPRCKIPRLRHLHPFRGESTIVDAGDGEHQMCRTGNVRFGSEIAAQGRCLVELLHTDTRAVSQIPHGLLRRPWNFGV
ncbi:hypothetical protein BH18ACI5_BH18ACI5_02880 [soil metagenome]